MELSLQRVEGNVVHLAVSGVCRDAIASAEKNPLGQVPLVDLPRHTVLVNMREVSMLNSSGVSWLLVCHKLCREAGGRWIVHSLPQTSLQVLRLMRLHEVLELAVDERRAELFAKEAAA